MLKQPTGISSTSSPRCCFSRNTEYCHFEKETIPKTWRNFGQNNASVSITGLATNRKANTTKEMKLDSFAAWCHETSKISAGARIFYLVSGWVEQFCDRNFTAKARPKTPGELTWHHSSLSVGQWILLTMACYSSSGGEGIYTNAFEWQIVLIFPSRQGLASLAWRALQHFCNMPTTCVSHWLR